MNIKFVDFQNIFFSDFFAGPRLRPWAKKWKETFSTKIDSNSVLLHFQGLLLLLNIKLVDFQNIFFSDFFAGPRLRPWGQKMKWNFFSQNWFECCSFAFSGPAFANEHKICGFSKYIFFRTFRRSAPVTLSQKMKWNFFNQNRFEFCSLAFSGPAVAIEHKICGFSKYIFFRTFRRSAPVTLSQKMKWNFFNQNRFEFCSLAFSGPAVAIEHKIGGFSKYIFFRFFHRSAPAAWGQKMKGNFFNQNQFEFCSLAFSWPAVAIEHKIGGFSKYIFFRFFHRSAPAAWGQKMKWNFFSQNRFECCSFAFSGPAFANEHKICGFSNIFFSELFTGPRLRPEPKNEMKLFQPKLIANTVLLHFQGLLLLLNIKLVDFQNIFFHRRPKNFFQPKSQVRACGLLSGPKKMKWNFFSQNWFECCSFAFSGPAVAIEHKICGFSKYIFFRTFCRSAPAALSQKMKGNFFNQNRFEFCSLAFSGPAVAIEHKIGGFSKYIFFRTFSQVHACGLEAKKWNEIFSPKLIRMLFILHFQGLLLLLNIKLVDFQNIFLSDFFTGPHLRPKAKKWNETFSAKIDSNAVRLHFQGLLLQMNIKFVDFQNIFFSELFTGPRLRPWAKKWKETFSTKIDSNSVLLHFQGLLLLLNIKLVDFQNIFFSELFTGPRLRPWAKKWNETFSTKIDSNSVLLHFQGLLLLLNIKLVDFQNIFFSDFFTGPRLRPEAKKWNEIFSAKIDSNAVRLHFQGLPVAIEHKIAKIVSHVRACGLRPKNEMKLFQPKLTRIFRACFCKWT